MFTKLLAWLMLCLFLFTFIKSTSIKVAPVLSEAAQPKTRRKKAVNNHRTSQTKIGKGRNAPDQHDNNSTDSKTEYQCASVFGLGSSSRVSQCVLYESTGERCDKDVQRTLRSWTQSLYRTLSSLSHDDQDFDAIVRALSEHSLCSGHGRDRRMVGAVYDRWIEELGSALEEDRIFTATIPSHALQQRCQMAVEPGSPFPCSVNDCSSHMDRWSCPGSIPGSFLDVVTAIDPEEPQFAHWPLNQRYIDRFGDIPKGGSEVFPETINVLDVQFNKLSDLFVRITTPMFQEWPPKYPEPLLECVRQPLQRGEQHSGYLYAYTKPSTPGFVKLGWTRRPLRKRLNELKRCDPDLLLIGRTSRLILFAKRAEKLIHKYFEQSNRRRGDTGCRLKLNGGKPCSKIHNEWFEVSLAEAHNAIEHWVRWISNSDAYDANGDATTRLVRVLSRLVPDGQDHAAWQLRSIMSMSQAVTESLWHPMILAAVPDATTQLQQDKEAEQDPTGEIVTEQRSFPLPFRPVPTTTKARNSSPSEMTPTKPSTRRTSSSTPSPIRTSSSNSRRSPSVVSTPLERPSPNPSVLSTTSSIFSACSAASSATDISEAPPLLSGRRRKSSDKRTLLVKESPLPPSPSPSPSTRIRKSSKCRSGRRKLSAAMRSPLRGAVDQDILLGRYQVVSCVSV